MYKTVNNPIEMVYSIYGFRFDTALSGKKNSFELYKQVFNYYMYVGK